MTQEELDKLERDMQQRQREMLFGSINTHVASVPVTYDLQPKESYHSDDFYDAFRHDISYSIDNPGHTYAADEYSGSILPMRQKEATPYQNSIPQQDDKWYKGTQPTLSETYARIQQLSKTDMLAADEMYNKLLGLRTTPGNPYYTPYANGPTSKALSELKALGIDVSGPIDQSFFDKYNYYTQNNRFTATGITAAAPTKTSTKAQNIAYWLGKAYDDWQKTEQVKTQWDTLKNEVAFMATNTDRNYSFDQVLNNIDWSKYNLLTKMDEGAYANEPVQLTSAIDYSQDNLKGVYWAAMNGRPLDNLEIASIEYAAGRGKTWQENRQLSEELNPGNYEKYHPFAHGSTLPNDVLMQLGTTSLTKSQVADLRGKIDWNDPNDVKLWDIVFNAEVTTEKAEEQKAELDRRIDSLITMGVNDPAVIMENALNGLDVLNKMDAGRQNPKDLVALTRSVNYRREDVLADVTARLEEQQKKTNLPDFGMKVTETLGTNIIHPAGQPNIESTSAPVQNQAAPGQPSPSPAVTAAAAQILNTPTPTVSSTPTPAPAPTPTPPPVQNQSARAVSDAKTKAIQTAAPTILKKGTDDEKLVFSLAGVANAESYAADLAKDVQTGTADVGASYNATLTESNQFIVNRYVMSKQAIQQYEGLQADMEQLQKQREQIVQQRDQAAEAFEQKSTVMPGVAQTEIRINGETHVLTADYDTASKEFIIHDSNPTSDKRTEQEIEIWKNNLRYGLNLDEFQAEQDYYAQGEIDALNGELRDLDQDIAHKEKQLSTAQIRYDQAKADLNHVQGNINAVGMMGAMQNHPGIDFSTPEGQQVLAEETAKAASLQHSIDHLGEVGNTYEPTNWTDMTMYQSMEAQGASKEQVGKLAAEGKAYNQEALDRLTAEEQQVKQSGVAVPQGWQANIDREKAKLQRDIQDADDYLIQTQPGFDESASRGADAVRNDKSHQYSELTKAILNPGAAHTTVQGQEMSFVKFVNAMSEDEKKTYAALLDQKGEAAAVDYFERMTDSSYGVLQTRVSKNMQEAVADFSGKYPWLAYPVSVLSSPATITGAGYTLYSLIAGKEINPTNEWFHTTTGLSTMEGVSKEKILDSTGLEEGSVGRTLLGWGLDGVSQAIKSAENAILTGPLTGGISNPIIQALLSSVPMGLQSAGATAQEVKNRDGSDLQAGLEFGIDFASNTLTEALTYENIHDAYNKGAKGVRAAAKNSILTNPFVEETFGEGIGYVVDYVSDNVIMGALSDRSSAIAKYEETMSHEDAVKEADKDFWRGLLQTGLTTMLSTGVSQGTSYAAGRISSIGNTDTTTPTVGGQARAYALENGLPLDYARNDQTARTLSLLTSALNANKSSQTMALSAALMPATGDQQSQNAAVSAGLRLADRFGPEQAISTMQQIMMDAEQNGIDQSAIKNAMTVAALGYGEAAQVLSEISETGTTGGDVQALIDAAGRDKQNPAITDRMQAIIHNDRVSMRTRDLIGDGALNGVQPYEQAYSQAKAQEAQTQQNLEAEQERAQTMGENLKTVQAQHVEDPANPALAGAMKQAVKDVAGQVKVVGEYQQGLENQQQKTRDAEKDLNRVREEAMTKVREQAMADVQAEEQAEAQAKAEQAEKERQFWIDKYKKKYPNAEGEFDRVGHYPSLTTEDYTITPVERDISTENITAFSLEGFVVKFNHPLSEAEINLLNERGEYNEETGEWHSNNQRDLQDIGKTQDEVKAILAQADSGNQNEATSGSNPNAGTVYTNDQVPVSYHWALVPASDLITSNTDTGEANSAYPAELQPRDRTRAASQDQVAGMVRNLNPARLGESADAQNGAPIVGPDNVVESGNARTMAIRQAMASNPESAARYTQYVRDNAARFGLNPDDVMDNSVLVRVRDTDLDRVAFARAANESTTAGYSPSENARSDAERLTPRMMEQFTPSDAGRLDNTENHAFALAFLNEIIPESERGAYMQDDGSISQQGYDRIRNAVFQRAYGSTALTQVLTEDTDGGSRNVMNALLKAAPRMMALQDAVSQGEVYDTGLPQKIAEAAQRYMELKNAGMNVETYLGQTVMPGFQTEDEATKSFMRLFEEYRRSGKKLAEALSSIADVVEEVGDPRAISFLGDVEVPSLPELIRQGVERMLRPKDSLVNAYRTNGVKVSPSLTPQQQQAQQQGQNQNNQQAQNVVSPQETIRQLTDALGITNDTRIKKYLRHLRNTTRGYTWGNSITHTRNFQNARTAMHEIGHNLDYRLGLQDMVNRMGPMRMEQLAQDYAANIDPNFLMQYGQNKIPNELMAEFSRVWAMDRTQAVNWAGEDFVNQYERALQDHGWLKAMQTAAEQMRQWADASSMSRAESMVRLGIPQKVRDKLSLNKVRSIVADHTLPLERVANAVARATGDSRASADARELLLARPTIVKNFTDANLQGTLVDMQGNPVLRADGTEYGSMQDILENIDRRDEKAFNTYLLALLDVDRRAQGKGLFAEGINSDALIAQYEAQHPEFRDTANRLSEWYNKFFETWLVDTGIVPRDQFDTMRAMYPHYVPLHAADESIDRPSGKRRTDGNPASVLERAFESDSSKYNPVMGLVENVQKYVMTAKTIEALRAFDTQMGYAIEHHLDVGNIAEPAQPDMERIDQRRAKRNIAAAVGQVVNGIQQNGIASQQDVQAVMDAIANVADFDYVVHRTASGNDVINIPRADGSIGSWTIYNPELLKALTMTDSQGNLDPLARKLINAVSTVTRFMSANVTSRSLKFSGQNVLSDMETASTTGRTGHNNVMVDILAGARPYHAAKEIVAGLDLLRNKIAESALGERLGMETSDRYEWFKRFGMLGSRYAFKDSKTQKEIRQSLYGGHKSFGEALLDVVKSPINLVEAFSGFGEEMTRYNAFALSGYDLSTYEGRLQAAKANREATTDFSKFGSGSDSSAFKLAGAAIPFINAQIQGIDKTIDTLHEIRNDPRRRTVLLGRMAINSILLGAATAAFRNIAWGDDDKEGYEELTDYEKTKFIHLFRLPDGSWFKMKRSQDMVAQGADLLGEYLGEVSTGYEGDALSDLVNGAGEIIKNGMISTDTSLQPFFDALRNETWYGSDIDTYSDKKMSPTARWGVDTSKFGRVVSTLIGGAMTPKAVDYAVKQFMGSAGTLGTAILGTVTDSMNDKRFNGSALLGFLKDEGIGGYIIDPVFSNKIATTFYDGKEKLDFMQNEIKNGRTPEMFRSNLTQEEANKAAKELETMLSKGGAVYDANKQYSDIKKEYNAVMSDDTTLTPVQQAEKARELRHQMNVALLTANAAMGDFFTKYGYNSVFDQAAMNTMNILSGDQNKAIPDSAGGQSDYDSMPQTFKDDENEPYMQKSKAVYEATGERSALPHPQMNFTSKGVEYEIAPEDQDTYNSLYKTTYQKYIAANSGEWDAMTDEQRLDVLNDAHNKARDTAKGWYKKKHNIK